MAVRQEDKIQVKFKKNLKLAIDQNITVCSQAHCFSIFNYNAFQTLFRLTLLQGCFVKCTCEILLSPMILYQSLLLTTIMVNFKA